MTVDIWNSLVPGDFLKYLHSGVRVQIIDTKRARLAWQTRMLACNGIAHFPISFYDKDMYELVVTCEPYQICIHGAA